MKCLRVKDNVGEFSLDGVSYSPIDKIAKEDILLLVDIALDKEQKFDMDSYDDKMMSNPANKIIYCNIFDKFADLVSNKDQFGAEINEKYKDAYDEYKLQEDDSPLLDQK